MSIAQPGMIFNAFVCGLIFFIALFVSLSILKENKGNKLALAYAGFWLLFSFIWLFTSLRQIFAQFGFQEWDRRFFIADQFFVFSHMILGGYYIYFKLFGKEKHALTMSVIFSVLGAVSFYGIFKYGVKLAAVTYFATKWSLNQFSWVIFNILFVLLIGAVLIHCLQYVFGWIKNRKLTDFYTFLASFAILFYGLIGYFDEKAVMAGWSLIFFRLLYIIAVVLAFISFTGSKEKVLKNHELTN